MGARRVGLAAVEVGLDGGEGGEDAVDLGDLKVVAAERSCLHQWFSLVWSDVGYSPSVRCSPHSVSPSARARCVMKVTGAAPCQCPSPGGVTMTSPGRMRMSA